MKKNKKSNDPVMLVNKNQKTLQEAIDGMVKAIPREKLNKKIDCAALIVLGDDASINIYNTCINEMQVMYMAESFKQWICEYGV